MKILEISKYAVKNFGNHSSIVAIENNRNSNGQLSFKPATKEIIAKEISNLKLGKAVCSNETCLLIKQHFYIQRQAEIAKKIKQNLSNTLRLNFCCLKIIHFLQPRYHQKIIGNV